VPCVCGVRVTSPSPRQTQRRSETS
jgi:hypothetical protein